MSKKEYIHVWDLLVRISHWSLFIFVLFAFLSGDEKNPIHIYSGYIVLVIISLRVVWGFIGSKYARFSNFTYPPNQAIKYIKELTQGDPKYYIGHNPAAGWMVIFLLITLAFVCATGHMAYKSKGKGLSAQSFTIIKYAHADSDDDDNEDGEHFESKSKENEFWEEIHEGASFVLIVLILLHVSGALVSSKLHHENLVKSMITGKKEKKADQNA